MALGPRELVALREKYAELVRLRELHAAPDEPDPRAALAAVAARFPGSLRELDETPMPALRGRLEELEAAVATPTHAARWMEAVHLFHFYLRGALAAKRANAGDGSPEARAWRRAPPRIATQPGGRLVGRVLERVAADLGLTPEEARRMVFPYARRT